MAAVAPRSRRSARLLTALPPGLRGAALLPAAALLVHQLRYELAFGADAPRALAAQGHAYLSSLTPWIVLLATLALGASLGALAQRWASGAGARRGGSPRRPGLRLWLLTTLVLLAVYTGQEMLEGLLAPGHPVGVAGVLGGGGWCALPLAVAVAGLLTLALRAGAAAGAVLGELRPLRLRLRGDVRRARIACPAAPVLAAPGPLASAAAGRAPPRRAATALPA
jgi:hypothetical protein